MQLNDISPISGIIGGLIGAGAAYWFGLRSESKKNYRKLKTDCYVDFMRSVAGIAIAQKNSDKAGQVEFLRLLTDSKIRIAIYGSDTVMAETAKFFELYGHLNSAEAETAFIQIMKLMRLESGAVGQISDNQFSQLIFGVR